MDNIIVEIEFQKSELKVIEKGEDLFDLYVGDEIKHPDKDAKSIMRALGHYLYSLNYQIEKLQNLNKK